MSDKISNGKVERPRPWPDPPEEKRRINKEVRDIIEALKKGFGVGLTYGLIFLIGVGMVVNILVTIALLKYIFS